MPFRNSAGCATWEWCLLGPSKTSHTQKCWWQVRLNAVCLVLVRSKLRRNMLRSGLGCAVSLKLIRATALCDWQLSSCPYGSIPGLRTCIMLSCDEFQRHGQLEAADPVYLTNSTEVRQVSHPGQQLGSPSPGCQRLRSSASQKVDFQIPVMQSGAPTCLSNKRHSSQMLSSVCSPHASGPGHTEPFRSAESGPGVVGW